MQFVQSSFRGIESLFRAIKRSSDSKYRYRWEHKNCHFSLLRSTIVNPFENNVGIRVMGGFKRKTNNVSYYAGIYIDVVPLEDLTDMPNKTCDLALEITNKGIKEAIAFDAAPFQGNLVYTASLLRTDDIAGFVKLTLIEV